MVGEVEKVEKRWVSKEIGVENAIEDLKEEIEHLKEMCRDIFDRFESRSAMLWLLVRGLSNDEVEKIEEYGREAEFSLWDIVEILEKVVKELEEGQGDTF